MILESSCVEVLIVHNVDFLLFSEIIGPSSICWKDLGNPASAGDSHPHDNRCWTKNKQHDNHGCNKQWASSTSRKPKVHNIWIQELLTTVFKVSITEKYKKQQKQLRCQIQCNLTTERLAPSWSVDGKLETLESQCWSSCQASTPLLPIKCDKFTLLSYSENLFKQNLMLNRVNVYFLTIVLNWPWKPLNEWRPIGSLRLRLRIEDRGVLPPWHTFANGPSTVSLGLQQRPDIAVTRLLLLRDYVRPVWGLSLSLVVISWSEAGLWASLTVSRLGQAEATTVQLRPHTGSLGQQTLANELKLPD